MPFSFSVPAFLSPCARSAFRVGPRPVGRSSSAAAVLASIVAIAGACLTAGVGEGAVMINIYEEGGDLIMSASGDYDLTNATTTGSQSQLNQPIVLPGTLYGFTTPLVFLYPATFSSSLTGNRVDFDTETVTNPFFFWSSQGVVAFSGGLTGSVNESATAFNTTLAANNLVAGESITVTWGNGGVNEQGTVNVGVAPVPEPSTWALGAFALACGGWQLTRRRRALRVKALAAAAERAGLRERQSAAGLEQKRSSEGDLAMDGGHAATPPMRGSPRGDNRPFPAESPGHAKKTFFAEKIGPLFEPLDRAARRLLKWRGAIAFQTPA